MQSPHRNQNRFMVLLCMVYSNPTRADWLRAVANILLDEAQIFALNRP